MASNVSKCGVEECKFNKNFQCHADSIAVMSCSTNKVENSTHTMCDTFAPQE